MTINFNENAIVSNGGFKPSTIDTPIDMRTRITNIDEVSKIPLPYVGMIFYVLDEERHYKVISLKSKIINDDLEVPNSVIDEYAPLGGGGGNTTIGTLTSELDQQTISVAVNEPLVVDLFFTTPNVGAGMLHVMSNGAELLKQSISMGKGEITLNLAKGTHKLEIYVVDRGGVYTNTVLLTVYCGGLDISTTFNSDKDYIVGSTITFPYTIDTISNDPITTYFKIGDNTYETISKKNHNTYIFPTLGVGTYTVEVYSVSGDFESNKIRFTLVMLNSDSLYVSSLFDKTEAEEGDQLVIDYRISMQKEKEFKVEYYVDGVLHKKGIGYNGTNTFPISTLPVGHRKITIKVITKDSKHSAQIDIYIEIKESSYQLQQPITQGLMAWFDAYGLSNLDLERGIWKDRTGKYTGTLHNFNYNTNGWIDNGLKMNGSAYTKIDVQPFLNNADTGLTLDIEFKTEDVGNENARVIDCTTRLSSALGCYIDVNEAVIRSNANTVKSPFAQNEKTRITYVIDRINKLIKVYVNAVLCEAAFLTDIGNGNDEILEEFGHSEYIYLNSQKGESNFGDCTVYSIRVYGRPLDSEEVLKNHIADIKDKTAQKQKYDFNFNNTIPTMYFYGDTSAMTKENKVPLRIKYISTDDKLYGASFDLPKCEVNWQGTSSIQYAIKNYKIRLKGEDGKKFKRPLREGMIPENKFTLKADYMESSHANNTGAAKIVNRYLYETPLPPQKDNKKVLSAIDGFPIKLYINDELYGVYNFNIDKKCPDSFGLDTKKYPKCISYEFSANTDTTAGAFNKWTPDMKISELEYLQKDIELRYPEPDEKKGISEDYGYLSTLKRVIDWVSDADDETFKAEFENYFNKEYTLKYYLLVLAFGMVDNLGKNLILNTWDGEIWYPCFYDLDTILGLDNSGYLKFDVDIEVESGNFNTSASKLWRKVARVFDSELKAMYKKMRASTFKEANIFKVLINEQIDQIPELLYNLDGQQKYLSFGKSYIHMLHGSRREHMRKWITERLLYLDSKLGYEEHTKESITVRANKLGYVYFDIKTYSPMYIKVVWRNNTEQIQKVGRNETKRFSYNLPTETDQEIFIYGAKHLKEIGDISHMTPTSLSLSNASRLTKLECRNNNKLQALGMGGVANGVSYNLKNLQLLDLTNCSKLGTVSGNNGLDLSYCDNLKTLKVQGTSLQNVIFNPRGGNLEELYMSNSVTSLYLSNQYNLRKVEFPNYGGAYRLDIRDSYNNGSKIANLTINNCPNLTMLGTSAGLDTTNLRDYRGVILNDLDDSSSISKEEYVRTFKLGCFSRLESVKITNSLLNYIYYTVNGCPNLTTLSFNSMPNLKGLLLLGNRNYGGSGGVVYSNLEGTPMFESIDIDKCPNFDTIIIQTPLNSNRAFKFKESFEWDLSYLPLKRFICNIALQNLKKLILPKTIEEFSHSNTNVIRNWNEWASDGSYGGYETSYSPLETIVIDGYYDKDFVGIDLANRPLKNVSLGGLTKKVNIIKNVNCEAEDLINPRIISGHLYDVNSSNNIPQAIENITINLNNYKGKSLHGLFATMDMTKVKVISDKPLTSGNIDYTHMFNQARNVKWDNIKRLINNLPEGNLFRAFERCDVDRLEVGHMIGPTTKSLFYNFQGMPNVSEISLKGADTSELLNMVNAFGGCPNLITINLEGCNFTKVTDQAYSFNGDRKLKQIVGIENLLQENCTTAAYMFCDCNSLPTINLSNSDTRNVTDMTRMFSGCKSLTSIDLSKLNTSKVTRMNTMFNSCTSLTSIDLSNLDTRNVTDMYAMLGGCTSLTSVNLSNLDTRNVSNMSWIFGGCTSLTSVNLSNLDTRNVVQFNDVFNGCTSLTSVNLSNLDMSKVIGMQGLFNGCTSLISANLSNMTTKNLANISWMFTTCRSLKTIDLSNLDMSKVSATGEAFSTLPELRDVKFGKGITVSFRIHTSNLLTVDSLLSILRNVGTAKPNQYLTLGPTNLKKLSEDQIKIATDKNWSVT